jgi:hypothetical protein
VSVAVCVGLDGTQDAKLCNLLRGSDSTNFHQVRIQKNNNNKKKKKKKKHKSGLFNMLDFPRCVHMFCAECITQWVRASPVLQATAGNEKPPTASFV